MSRASPRSSTAAAGVALLVSLAVGSLLMIAAQRSPLEVWSAMVWRTLGDPTNLGQVLFKATPLVLTGLAVALPLRVGLFHIGGEGQVIAGSLACAVVAAALPGWLGPMAPMVALAAAAMAGASLGAMTGALRAYRGAHEVIVAIVLNKIVTAGALYLGNRALFVGGSTSTRPISEVAALPSLGIEGSAANTALLISLVALPAVWWLVERSRPGFAWRMIGQNARAAANAGIATARQMVVVMTLAGALAGLCAGNFVLGYKHVYEEGVGRGVGFLGIAVALLAGPCPLGLAAAALLFGFLSQGGLVVADLVPKELVDVLQATVMLSIAVTWGLLRFRDAGRLKLSLLPPSPRSGGRGRQGGGDGA